MQIVVKTFQELTTKELYAILQLRSAVFVVEQNCVYQDLDGKDGKALHVVGTKNGKVVAYTRIFRSGDYFNMASIGRVVVDNSVRQFGYGKEIMKASIDAVHRDLNETTIKISAQTYLEKFYASLGFVKMGGEYLEDGIPHIGMTKTEEKP